MIENCAQLIIFCYWTIFHCELPHWGLNSVFFKHDVHLSNFTISTRFCSIFRLEKNILKINKHFSDTWLSNNNFSKWIAKAAESTKVSFARKTLNLLNECIRITCKKSKTATHKRSRWSCKLFYKKLGLNNPLPQLLLKVKYWTNRSLNHLCNG